jgi:hypothetical protein
MNQCLKRCLGLTEGLISEGKKALDYHVRVSDIAIGGRVLLPDEVLGEVETRRGLLSPVREDGIGEWDFDRFGDGGQDSVREEGTPERTLGDIWAQDEQD